MLRLTLLCVSSIPGWAQESTEHGHQEQTQRASRREQPIHAQHGVHPSLEFSTLSPHPIPTPS